MLHHGPNHTHLVIVPCGGLGNRLCALISALRFIEAGIYKSITIKWLITQHCSIHLSDIASLHVDYTLDDKIDVPFTKQFDLVKGFKYDSIYASNFWRYNPSDSIDQVVEAKNLTNIQWLLPPPLAKPKIGLHCRRSDWGLYSSQAVHLDIYAAHNRLDKLFYNFVLPKIDEGDTFIASDSNESIRFFKSRIDDLKYQVKPEYPIDTQRNKSMNRETLVDLATLAASDTIIRDSASSFPLIAHIIGRNSLITWNRPILKDSGQGITFNDNLTI